MTILLLDVAVWILIVGYLLLGYILILATIKLKRLQVTDLTIPKENGAETPSKVFCFNVNIMIRFNANPDNRDTRPSQGCGLRIIPQRRVVMNVCTTRKKRPQLNKGMHK